MTEGVTKTDQIKVKSLQEIDRKDITIPLTTDQVMISRDSGAGLMLAPNLRPRGEEN